MFPEQDDAADVAAVKLVRAAIRIQLARIEKDNVTRTKAMHAKYDQVLASAQTQLTQLKRLDDAVLVKNKREEVAAAWNTPPATTSTKANYIPKDLVGTWRIRSLQTPWNEALAFHEDGTFGTPESRSSGKWKVVGSKVHIIFNGGGIKKFVLPMDPKGTKVLVDNDTGVQSAVKEE